MSGVLTASALVSRESVVAYLRGQGLALVSTSEVHERYFKPTPTGQDGVMVPFAWDTCPQRDRTMVLIDAGIALEKTEVEVLSGICSGAARSNTPEPPRGLSAWERQALSTGAAGAILRAVDPPPEHRWSHLGGTAFCRGEHAKSTDCEGFNLDPPIVAGGVFDGHRVVEVALVDTREMPATHAARCGAGWGLTLPAQPWCWMITLNRRTL